MASRNAKATSIGGADMIELGAFKEVANTETSIGKLTEYVDVELINILEMDQPLYKMNRSIEKNGMHDQATLEEGDIAVSKLEGDQMSDGTQSEAEQDGDILQELPEKKGGSYKDVFTPGEGETREVHHMPANDVNGLSLNDGPAIKMEKADHRETASCGNSREAREYRAKQQELIDQGKFREALQMDIDDIQEKFGDKYDDAIAEMIEYVDQIEKAGII